jgi:hypothetical protein
MLVSVAGFGSLWRWRFDKNQDDPRRFGRGVYYNTTGVEIAGTVRQQPKITGYARFHPCGGFDPHHPPRAIGWVFECAEPCVWKGDNKLVFRCVLPALEKPDRFLVVIRPNHNGLLGVGSPTGGPRHMAHCLQRQWRRGGNAFKPNLRQDTYYIGSLCSGTRGPPPVDCMACARVCHNENEPVRYRKGTIALSDSQDYPLLRRVLQCGFVTSTQLYEFMKLDYCASSRNAFDNRLRRLLAHKLLVRHEMPSMNRGVVYPISRAVYRR